jgi:hypothetical protein
MRKAAILLGLLALTGCTDIHYDNSDSFQIGDATPFRFELDNQACALKAGHYVDYDSRMIQARFFARHRGYNAVYAACMKARGYVPRPYIDNLLP